MNIVTLVLAAAAAAPAPTPAPTPPSAPTTITVAGLAGSWTGTLRHAGETQSFGLELVPAGDGKLALKGTIPAIHVVGADFGTTVPRIEGPQVELGFLSFTYDPHTDTLNGVLPQGLVPVYPIPVTLHRVDSIPVPERPEPTAPVRQPVWTFDAGSPLWAGARIAEGVAYAGGQDGRLHALDVATGEPRWSFEAGGPIRTRPTVASGVVYFQADDGYLYAVSAADGTRRWRVRVVETPIERLPFDNPESRYDRFGSDVVVADGRLYLGTHDGRLLAMNPADGATVWEFAASDSILAAPAVAHGRIYFGSYDGSVFALDASTGTPAWRRKTNGAVVSTPARAGDRLVVGNRAYDLLGLDTATGAQVWSRYIWFSWVESSATIRDGVAYVGSSDAAAVFAFDAMRGATRWQTDVYGWAWGQPAVTDDRVYVGCASQVGYLAGHQGGVMALDRESGEPVWRYPAAPAESGAYGFPGSPVVADGRVVVTGLDGRVYAFAP